MVAVIPELAWIPALRRSLWQLILAVSGSYFADW
jgi:hypothetical protein